MKKALANDDDYASRATGRSVTWDRGKEMSAHAQFKVETGIPVFFADPQARGNAARTRTPTDCCGSTSQGHRPLPLDRDESKPSLTPEHQAPQDPRLADPRGGVQ